MYCWTDHGTSKLYVGLHKGRPDDGYICSSKHMLRQYKQRPHDFTREILAINTYDVCRNFETSIIKAMFRQNVHCYNLNVAGAIIYTPEIRSKISQTHKGKVISSSHIEAIKEWNRTKRLPASEETKEKIRQAKLGKKRGPLPEEWRRKISEAGKGLKRPDGFGAAVSARQLGKKRSPLTEEQKEKQRVAQTGRKHSEETLIKLRAAKAKTSDETKAKMSEARKLYWARKRMEKQNDA